MIIKRIFALCFLCCLLHFSTGAFACNCAIKLGPLEHHVTQFIENDKAHTSTIFLGKAVVVENGGGGKLVTFQVDQWWHTAVPDRIQVFTGFSGDVCGYEFAEGQDYLVFAYSPNENVWSTNSCSLTTGASTPLLDILGKGNKPAASKSAPIPYNLIGITLIGSLIGYIYFLTVRQERRKRQGLPPTS